MRQQLLESIYTRSKSCAVDRLLVRSVCGQEDEDGELDSSDEEDDTNPFGRAATPPRTRPRVSPKRRACDHHVMINDT